MQILCCIFSPSREDSKWTNSIRDRNNVVFMQRSGLRILQFGKTVQDTPDATMLGSVKIVRDTYNTETHTIKDDNEEALEQ